MTDSPNRDSAGSIPPLRFTHLFTLSDTTGILQHASGSVANRHHGYCTDDNARALVVACGGHRLDPHAGLDRMASYYLSYLHHAWSHEQRRFRNFMSYERRWLDPVGSEDSHGRAVWGLGVAASTAPFSSLRRLAADLLEESFRIVPDFTSPRAWAYAILGMVQAPADLSARCSIDEVTSLLADRLNRAFVYAADGWPWCEDSLTYDNALLPWALLVAGVRLERPGLVERGLEVLDWLFREQEISGGALSLVGNDGWMVRGSRRAAFDQQPLDAASLLMASGTAYEITGLDIWRDRVGWSMAWFLGENDAGCRLLDPETGGCCDGISLTGANRNQGAESTIAWLMARLRWEEMRLHQESPLDVREAR